MNLNSLHIVEPDSVGDLSSLDRQKLYVDRILNTSRVAYEDMDVFENVVLVLNDIEPDVGKMEGCAPIHI